MWAYQTLVPTHFGTHVPTPLKSDGLSLAEHQSRLPCNIMEFIQYQVIYGFRIYFRGKYSVLFATARWGKRAQGRIRM